MKNVHIRVILKAIMVVVCLLAAGCGSGSGSSSNSSSVTVGPAVVVAGGSSFTNNISAQARVALALNPAKSSDWAKFLSYFTDIMSHSSYDVELRKMNYSSRRADGTSVTLSGLLILPRGSGSTRPAVPIMMYQHGTEPYRAYAPSRFIGNNPLDYPEVIFAISMAMTGYAIALPDYQGLGDNTDIQPFVHADTLAGQVIDMLRATRDTIGGTAGGISSPCTWNGKLFLMGYSEGGFVTLAATRDLQLNHASEFTVTASAPMAGPHDLSGAMRSTMLADTTFKAPYFIPFFLASYYNIYQNSGLSPNYTLKSPYNTTLPPLLDGNHTGEDINKAMGMTYSPVSLIVAKSVLTTQFIADLQSTGSAVYGYLRQNDTYRGWTPTVPVRLFHNPNDDLVPFANSRAAFNSFSSAGAKRWVSLASATDTVDISSSEVTTIHVASAIPELHDAWSWFYTNF